MLYTIPLSVPAWYEKGGFARGGRREAGMAATPIRRRRDVVVLNEIGLHARPAAMLVRLAQEFDSEIALLCDQREANAKSMLSVLTLCAGCGAKVTVTAEGPDADTAIREIESLFARKFAPRETRWEGSMFARGTRVPGSEPALARAGAVG
jgi:phosphocarrier protein